jgi:uncharacterized protein (TIGR01777 family)
MDAVVHLAGARIDVRWTRACRLAIRESRVQSTRLLSRVMSGLPRKPAVFVCGSAVGYYGDRGDEELTEESAPGAGFLAAVVREWEEAAREASVAGIRVVNIRTGVVLSGKGGMLRRLLLPFRFGLGGPIGGGDQWMSWVGLHDHVRAVRLVLASDISGPVNVVAPNPVTNRIFVQALGRALSRPAFIPLPALALRIAYGQMAQETILASQRALPGRLSRAGFVFETPEVEGALRRELTARPG